MADSSYQLQVGDLIEFRPAEGIVHTGRIVRPYGKQLLTIEGKPDEYEIGYGIDVDGCDRLPNGFPYFAPASAVRLRPDVAAARECNAFQAMLSGILTAPRRGRRPKSPYPPTSAQDLEAGRG